jgi:hypothetical protein
VRAPTSLNAGSLYLNVEGHAKTTSGVHGHVNEVYALEEAVFVLFFVL